MHRPWQTGIRRLGTRPGRPGRLVDQGRRIFKIIKSYFDIGRVDEERLYRESQNSSQFDLDFIGPICSKFSCTHFSYTNTYKSARSMLGSYIEYIKNIHLYLSLRAQFLHSHRGKYGAPPVCFITQFLYANQRLCWIFT